MVNKKRHKSESVQDLLRDMMIIQLALAGVPQQKIREIVGVDLNRVNAVAKHIKKSNG